METATSVSGIHGDKTYQLRARRALPILVRQAHAKKPMTYSALALELGMSNPRVLSHVLGSIGVSLEKLSEEGDKKILPIQCLVINKAKKLPGKGVGWFVRDYGEFAALPLREQRNIVDAVLSEVYAYRHWYEILEELSLEPLTDGYEELIEQASAFRGGGESKEHEALKEFVLSHPGVVGLSPRKITHRKIEHRLPSGDEIDVYFEQQGLRMAVEVKARHSPMADLVRGLYQCVKYRAILEAVVAASNSQDSVDVRLVLETPLPPQLHALKHTLQITVIENVAQGLD